MHRLAALIPRKDWWGPREGCSRKIHLPLTRAPSNYTDKLGEGESGRRRVKKIKGPDGAYTYSELYSVCVLLGKKKLAPTPSTLTLATIATTPCVSLTFAIFFGLSTLCKITSSLPPFLTLLNERASVMLSTTAPCRPAAKTVHVPAAHTQAAIVEKEEEEKEEEEK